MPGTVEALTLELAKALEPLADRLTAPRGAMSLFAELGIPLPPAVTTVIESAPELPEVATSVTEIGSEVPTLAAAIAASDRAAIAASVARALPAIRAASQGMWAMAERIRAAFPADLSGFPSETRELIAGLPERLLAWIVVSYLETNRPLLFRTLAILGLVESTPVPAVNGGPALVRRTVHPHRFGDLLEDPEQHFGELYGWGDTSTPLDALLLLTRLDDLLDAADVPGVLDSEAPELRALWFSLGPAPGAPPTGLDLGLTFDLLEGIEFPVVSTMPLADDGTLAFHVEATAELAGGIVVTFHPSGVDAGDDTAAAGSFRMELAKAPAAGESAIVLFGDPAGTRLEARGLTLGVGGDDGDFYVAAALEGFRLVVDVSGDALLAQLVSEPMVADAGDLVGGWRLGRGIYFEQGSGLTLRIPLDVEVAGVARLRQLGLRLAFEPETALTAVVSGDLSLGPLFLGVEDLGFRLVVTPNPDGRFGTFDLDAGVKVPSGYAADLDAGVISGGGHLEKSDHEYRGALSLRFESFGLSAFAILTTRMPSGRPGVSFLASIFGDVDVQLGYGFRLTGIGGIIGIDRRVDVDQLRSVLADGRLDSVMFPRAPIKDAAVILDDMAAIFPPARGQYLIGPMAKVAWGTPTLIEAKLGVIFEVGDETRAVVVGTLEAVLPARAAAIVVLRLDFTGTVELDTGAVGFDATLTSSRILSWPVTGEAAVRTGWGPSAGLVASVGGFHPAFSPPAGFPALRPMTIDFATNNPSLTLTAYLAITLGSVQAGAEASLYAKGPKIPFVGRFAVEGSVGFDALVHFDPFAFDAKLWLALDLLFRGDVVCGIGGDLRLRGPNRYEIKGKLRVKALGVTVKVGIDKAWGTPVTETPQRVDGVQVLRAAVETAQGFEPIPVSTRVSGVGFARQERVGDRALVDPAGGVRFVQRALPLAVPIDRIGTSRLTGKATTFDLAFTDGTGGDGSPAIDGADAESEFVRGAFFDLSESERLRGPATEPHKSGIELRGADDLVFDEAAAQHFDLDYETIVLGDDEEDAPAVSPHPLDSTMAERSVRLTAETTTSPLNGNYVPLALAGERVGVAPISYVAVGGAAVESGPTPVPTPSGELVTGPLTSVTRRLGAGQRAVAGYLAAPAGPGG